MKLVSTIVTYLLGDAFPTAKAAWNEVIQERVAKTSVVLSQIKAIKMAGLEDAVSDELQKLRQEEIKKSIKTRLLGALFNLAGTMVALFDSSRLTLCELCFAARLRHLLSSLALSFGRHFLANSRLPAHSPPWRLLVS